MIIFKWLLHFIKFVMKEISSMLIKIAFFLFLGVLTFNYFSKTKKVSIAKKSYLKIDFSNSFDETLVQNPFSFNSNSINFYQLLKKIKSAKDDSNVEGLILFLDNNTLSKNQISELGEVLIE
ncbi:MAG: hypothetical protein ACRCZ2_03375, partial [Fusobacteriaceae bacterium]